MISYDEDGDYDEDDTDAYFDAYDGHDDVFDKDIEGDVDQRETFCYKLLPITGTTWIRINFAICGHFVFWARYEKCPEMTLLIFFGSQCKLQGKINARINFGHNF